MSLIDQTKQFFKTLNTRQKFSLLYCIAILLLAFFTPLITLQYFNSSTDTTIPLMHRDFVIVDILFVVVILKYALYTASLPYQSLVLNLTGIKIEGHTIPLLCLTVLSCMMLSIGATVTVLKNHATYMIDLAYGYYLLALLLICGMMYMIVGLIQSLRKKSQADTIMISKPPQHNKVDATHLNNHHMKTSDKGRSSLFEEV